MAANPTDPETRARALAELIDAAGHAANLLKNVTWEDFSSEDDASDCRQRIEAASEVLRADAERPPGQACQEIFPVPRCPPDTEEGGTAAGRGDSGGLQAPQEHGEPRHRDAAWHSAMDTAQRAVASLTAKLADAQRALGEQRKALHAVNELAFQMHHAEAHPNVGAILDWSKRALAQPPAPEVS